MNRYHPLLSWPRLPENNQVACHLCDTLHRLHHLKEGQQAICSNCGSVLAQNRRHSLARTLSFSMAAVIFIVLLHSFPIVTMELLGNKTELTLIAAIQALISLHDYSLASLIAIFTVIAPSFFTFGLIYVIWPLRFGRSLPGAFTLNIWIQRMQQWSMLEVFLLGFIVSLLKLGHIAEIHFGVGLWSLIFLVICLAASMSSIDNKELWDRLELSIRLTPPLANKSDSLDTSDTSDKTNEQQPETDALSFPKHTVEDLTV